MLLVLSIVICVFPLSATNENQSVSGNSLINDSNEHKNYLKVKADYVVTVKDKIKVYYKVRKKVKIKVKIRYKKNGKWKTKYRTRYVYKNYYRYYYKYVSRTYTVKDISPEQCRYSTANCQITPEIVAKMQSITVLENVTIPNPKPAPTPPKPVEEPAYVENPGPEPQIADYNNMTKYQEALDAWTQANTAYNNYLEAYQKYNQYLLDYDNYQIVLSEYQPYITVQKRNTYNNTVKIFEYVRNNLKYSFYYNTVRGASGTLKDMKGNCVDHSHLLVALARAAGIPARYVHGTCTFKKSGNTYGHVWAQLYVNGRWYSADATSLSNTLGVINSWYTNTYILKNIYASLPF